MNPANQLHKMFAAVLALPSGSHSWAQAWAGAMDVEEDAVLDHMAAVVSLYSQTLMEVRAREVDPSALLWAAPSWRRAVMMNDVRWSGPMSESGFVLEPRDVAGLYAVSAVLGSEVGHPASESSAVHNLTTALDELDKTIRGDQSLPTDLRIFLRQHSERMRTAVDEYAITGAWGISVAAKQVIADATTSPEVFDRVTSSMAGRRFLATVGAASIFLTSYNDVANKVDTAIENTSKIVHAVEQMPHNTELERGKALELPPAPDRP